MTIGSGVTSIGERAFYSCYHLTRVYYKGTANDWAKIYVHSQYNNYLTNVTRYYYSETEPALNEDGTAYDGNYWYYNDNNEIVVWTYTN